MLFWHKHNIDKSLSDLANFTPFPDEWTVEDRVLFEQAFAFHGKSFPRIRQMVCSNFHYHFRFIFCYFQGLWYNKLRCSLCVQISRLWFQILALCQMYHKLSAPVYI